MQTLYVYRPRSFARDIFLAQSTEKLLKSDASWISRNKTSSLLVNMQKLFFTTEPPTGNSKFSLFSDEIDLNSLSRTFNQLNGFSEPLNVQYLCIIVAG